MCVCHRVVRAIVVLMKFFSFLFFSFLSFSRTTIAHHSPPPPRRQASVLFDVVQRKDSGGSTTEQQQVPIIAPAATDYNDDDITVENTSAWASFGAVASNAPSEGSAGDADMSDFSKFQRLNQEKKVRRAAVPSVSCVVSQLCYPFEHHISPVTMVGHSTRCVGADCALRPSQRVQGSRTSIQPR